jgi:hypothetical protein
MHKKNSPVPCHSFRKEFPPEKNLWGLKILKTNLFFILVEIALLMHFMHLKMLNSASKCFKIALKVS